MHFKTLTALALASLVSAQTYTECDPTKKSMFIKHQRKGNMTMANLTTSSLPQ